MKRVTISFSSKLNRAVKAQAAKTGRSISDLVNEAVRVTLRDDATDRQDYERAKRHAKRILRRGFRLGGKFKISRDELHER